MSPVNGPNIGEPLGWRQVNGWEKLRRIIGSIPNAIPHIVVCEVVVDRPSAPTPAEGTVEATGTGSVLVPPECEFYCLATSVDGFVTAPGHPIGPLTLEQINSPEAYPGTVQVQYERGGFRWSNAPVRLGHMFGGARWPYTWPVPWIIPGGTTITATIASRALGNVGVTTTYRHFLSFIGFKRFLTDPPLATDFLMSPQALDVVRRARLAHGGVRVEPYMYALNFDELGDVPTLFSPRVPHGLEQKTFAVADADFAIFEQMGTIYSPFLHGVDPSPTSTVKVALDVGRRRVDDRAMPIQNMFGTARRPFRWGAPIVIGRGGNLTAFVQFSLFAETRTPDGEVPETGYLTFSGVRIFPTSYR